MKYNRSVDEVLDEIYGVSVDGPVKKVKHRFRDNNPQHIQEAAKVKAETKRQIRRDKKNKAFWNTNITNTLVQNTVGMLKS